MKSRGPVQAAAPRQSGCFSAPELAGLQPTSFVSTCTLMNRHKRVNYGTNQRFALSFYRIKISYHYCIYVSVRVLVRE